MQEGSAPPPALAKTDHPKNMSSRSQSINTTFCSALLAAVYLFIWCFFPFLVVVVLLTSPCSVAKELRGVRVCHTQKNSSKKKKNSTKSPPVAKTRRSDVKYTDTVHFTPKKKRSFNLTKGLSEISETFDLLNLYVTTRTPLNDLSFSLSLWPSCSP